jgi:exosortase E/protease (VPEID-CTERM system)
MDEGASGRALERRRLLNRWGVPNALLLLEYVLLSMRVDAANVTRWGGGWRWVGQLGIVAPLGVVAATAFLVLQPSLRKLPSRESTHRKRPVVLVAHAALLTALVVVTERIFGAKTAPAGPIALWLGSWVLLVTLTTGTLFAFFGDLVAAPLRLLTGSVGLAVLVAAGAWAGGIWSLELWAPLSSITLNVVATLLDAFFPYVALDPERRLLQLGDFVVEVAPICSGFEGIGLMFVLVSAYLFAFREQLKFPRAFLLLPLGIVCAWLGNCVRIAALMAVGAYVSETLAFGAFHSKAGWIAFSAVVLGITALGHRSSFFSLRAHEELENPSAPFLLPFVAVAAAALVTGAFETEAGSLYPIRMLVGVVVLGLFWQSYRPLWAVPSAWSALLGIGVGVAWLLLVRPGAAAAAPAPAESWRSWLRILGTISVAPLCEELAFRGFLQRWLVARDFGHVEPSTWKPHAVLIASVAFGLIHHHFIAGTLAGIAFGVAQIRSGRVIDAVAAHAAANATLAVAVLFTRNWELLG